MRFLFAGLFVVVSLCPAGAQPRQRDPALLSQSFAPIVWPKFRPAMSAMEANETAMAPGTPSQQRTTTKFGGPVGGR